LFSCSTGAGGAGAHNLANFVAPILPNTFVHAPTTPTNGTYAIDEATGRAKIEWRYGTVEFETTSQKP
jgi:hypothetical protein